MVCLARVMRRVIVASGTRKARAISRVFNPPTARRVSAICDAADSAGWQHMNNRMSVSSVSAARCSAGPGRLRGRRAVQPPEGDRDHPAERVVGTTPFWPGSRGGNERLLGCVLGGVEVAVAAYPRAEDLRRQEAQQNLLGFAQ